MRFYCLPKAESYADLTLRERDTPKPGRGQILVKMKAASLNYRDLMVATGRYARGGLPKDLVPLSDGAGEVVEIGDDVDRVKVGDRVAGIFMQTWIGGHLDPTHGASALGGAIDGVLSEYVLFDQNGVVTLPEHLSYEAGATLPCAGVTAWHALFGSVQPLVAGQTVLLLGTGGVSIFGLQFARAAGARTIITSSSDEKLQKTKALGAHETVNYKQHPEWQEQVLGLTEGIGVDHVVEVGGAGTLPRSLRSTRPGGATHLIGVLTGGEINPAALIQRSVVLEGIYVGSREMFDAMNRAIALHRIEPVIDKVFSFDEAEAAYRYMDGQSHVGKVVIRFEG